MSVAEMIETQLLRRLSADQVAHAGNPMHAAVMESSYFRFKSLLDRAIGVVMLLFALPVIGILVVLIRLSSRGPGVFQQLRVGKGGRVFMMYKLRSMRVDAEAVTGPAWSVSGADPRVTKLGYWLRRLHLDELPQLINVTRGEMSLVGPRPERPEFVQVLANQIPGYLDRLTIAPGITGLAQINLPPDTDFDSVRRKLVLDLDYVRTATLWLDLRIIFCTVLRMAWIKGPFVTRLLGLERLVFIAPPEVEPAPPQPVAISDLVTLVESDDRHSEFASAALSVRELTGPRTKSNGVERAMPADSHSDERHYETSVLNAFTVDVEDYFQVSSFDHVVQRQEWDRWESRVEANSRRLLDMLAYHNVRGTFFVLGWVAERFPSLVREIHSAGHELGCHSYWHYLTYRLTPDEFRDDLRRAKSAIKNAAGQKVPAYRAPSFSITRRSQWALEVLVEEGFTVDSSIFPVVHDRYGYPGADQRLHQIHTNAGSIWEFPLAISQFGRWNIPVSGGGYFRLFPYRFTRRCLNKLNRAGQPFAFYVHPWEIDPEQPRIRGAGGLSNFRHYVNLASTERKLSRLLSAFRFGAIADVIAQHEAHTVRSASRARKAVAAMSG